jgi:hypothetical protein
MHCLSCGAQLHQSGYIQKCEYCGGVTQLNLRTNVSALSFTEKLKIKSNSEKFCDDLSSVVALAVLYLEDDLTELALNVISRGLGIYPTDAELHLLQAVALLSKDHIKKIKMSDIELVVRHLVFCIKIDMLKFASECNFILNKIQDGYFRRNSIKPTLGFLDLQAEVSAFSTDEVLVSRFKALQ